MALLIDADIIAYNAVSAVQNEFEFEPDVWQLYADIKEGRKLFAEKVDELMADTTQKDYLLCFSDPAKANFRKQLAPGLYKANRSARKPVGYWPLVTSIQEQQKKRVRHRPRLEADDVIGILATRDEGKHVIWSIDKDLKQLPGVHLIDGKEEGVSCMDADISFLTQVLTGDTVDNYPGCPGIGPVKAAKILQSAINANAHLSGDAVHCCWQAILNTFVAAELTEADALLQARLAFLLRVDNYNIETGKIRLWKPPAPLEHG
ncbi:hypothetical protein [Bradyrhizobium sp. SZCCHNRI2049]|uniref:hypothetical protein n=1 Tax=Bradyrhizobium sp. SZCCHNRI2049 TaxID=3057287 RepID=UPI002915E865|nr:hypothetical protein [Bradyrhizobium sp. SZCCHNRI2049]